MWWKTLPSAQLLVFLPYFSTLPEGWFFFFLHLSKIPFKCLLFCLCLSPVIPSVPNSSRICTTTKCLCAGAEQWWMQTAGWPAGTSPALLLMNYSFSTLIAFNVSPHLGSNFLLFNLSYFLWTVWPTNSPAKLPKITQHTLMTEDRYQPSGPLFSQWWLLIIWGDVNEGSTHSCYNFLFF